MQITRVGKNTHKKHPHTDTPLMTDTPTHTHTHTHNYTYIPTHTHTHTHTHRAVCRQTIKLDLFSFAKDSLQYTTRRALWRDVDTQH